MHFRKKFTTAISSLILLCTMFSQARAKSLYVISDTEDSNLVAYGIDGTALVYQTNYFCESDPYANLGAVGLAIDGKRFLFVTFEGQNFIEVVNAKAMQYADTFTIIGASNPAGIVADKVNSKVYVMQRYTNHLYSYSWNPSTTTLNPDFDYPYYIELQGMEYTAPKGAFGIALDEINNRLYVADNTTSVRYYNTNNWSHDPNTDYIAVSHNVISVAVDTANQYLYTGSMAGHGDGDPNLYQYDISAQTETDVNVGSSVVGIAVDQETSLVYITTYGDGGSDTQDRLIVYDSNLVKQSWDSGDIGNPAGVAVPDANVRYKPPFASLTFDKVDDVNYGDCVLPDDYITYTISYDANGTATDGITIIDYLAPEVTFVSASDGGVYDMFLGTVTWSIPYLGSDEANSVTLTVKVNHLAEPNGIITNYCEVESDLYYAPPVRVDTSVCCWATDIIYVDADADGADNGTSWDDAFSDLHCALDQARFCGANEIWVAEGGYFPTYPTYPSGTYATFRLADGVPIYGGFAGTETSRCQRNWIVNETILSGDTNGDGSADVTNVVTAFDANEATVDGFIITKGSNAGINCNSASLTSAHNTIKANQYGIYAISTSLTVAYSRIIDNEGIGVTAVAYDPGPAVIVIENSWICNNTTSSGSGIYLTDLLGVTEALIRNSTVVANGEYGVWADWTTLAPDINNCIIWDNTDGAFDPEGSYNVTYSCVQGASVYTGTGNINADPCFVDDPNDPNNYHLAPNSPCIDTGDPDYEPNDANETDIDGEDRLMDGDVNGTVVVDMGADEYYWSLADFNRDEIVNFVDYALFANHWQKTDVVHDYNDLYDLEDNNAIDYNDLALFCKDWLWQAGWTRPFTYGLGMGCGAEGMGMESQQMMGSSYQEEAEPIDIDEILEWLEEIWLEYEELREIITEQEWKDFLKAVKKAEQY